MCFVKTDNKGVLKVSFGCRSLLDGPLTLVYATICCNQCIVVIAPVIVARHFIVISTYNYLVPFFLIWSFVNSVAWAYGSTQALPWGTVVLLAMLWAIRKGVDFILKFSPRDKVFLIIRNTIV